jgi:uncharacterized protein YdhG (YjbR/CyaY superfamily)
MTPTKTPKFSAEEKAAMRERAQELKAEAKKMDGENAILTKIAEMPEPERSLATRIHQIVRATAPNLLPKTWYGMPAYAREEKVVCFFQSGTKYGSRYCTLGFTDEAKLDEGVFWATSYALTELTAEGEAAVVALVKKAVG